MASEAAKSREAAIGAKSPYPSVVQVTIEKYSASDDLTPKTTPSFASPVIRNTEAWEIIPAITNTAP